MRSLYNLETIGLRFFTVYGPMCRPDMAIFKFTDQMIKKLKEDKFEEDNMKTLHDIVRTKGANPLKFRDGQIKVDMQTANIILKVLPRVKTKSTVDKMTTIINKGRKAQFIKLVSSLQGTLSGSFTNGIRNRPI